MCFSMILDTTNRTTKQIQKDNITLSGPDARKLQDWKPCQVAPWLGTSNVACAPTFQWEAWRVSHAFSDFNRLPIP